MYCPSKYCKYLSFKQYLIHSCFLCVALLYCNNIFTLLYTYAKEMTVWSMTVRSGILPSFLFSFLLLLLFSLSARLLYFKAKRSNDSLEWGRPSFWSVADGTGWSEPLLTGYALRHTRIYKYDIGLTAGCQKWLFPTTGPIFTNRSNLLHKRAYFS